MRKSISLVLVIAMMLSMFVFAIPTSAATITQGSSDCDRVEAPYFEVAPTIDGIVSVAEWGEASVHVEAYDAATKDDSEPYSRFIFWRRAGFDDYSSWEFDLWLRWDLNYFYVAVKAKDPDKHVLKNGAGNTWNGDAIQTRVDWNGRMPASGGAKPWTNDQVPDFLLGYTQIAGGFTEAWENTSNRGMTAASYNPLGVTKAVVAPAGSDYSSDTQAGITTYEVAIPWAFIIPAANRTADFPNSTPALKYENWAGGRRPNPYGGIGKSLGMSLTVLDDGQTTQAGWDAFLAWGSGVCNQHQEEAGNITTGSNDVKLIGDKITPQAGYPTQDPTSLLNASFSTSNVDAPNTYYDYLAGDTYKENPVSYDALSVLKYDDPADLTTWGSAKLYNGSITNIGGEHGNVLDYTNPTLGNNYLSSEDGENINFKVPPSFTFEFDIRWSDLQTAGEGADKYASALYNWFGGANTVGYRCGYFFADGAFEIVDDIGADGTNPRILARYQYDLKKDNWYKWRFQFDNESCNVRLWIDDLSTDADNANNAWGTMIFNVKDRYFYYASDDVIGPDADGTLLTFRQMNVQTQYDNVKVYNFASNQYIETPSENTNQGGTVVTPPKTEVSQGTVDLGKVDVVVKDGKMYVPFVLATENDKNLWKNVSGFSFEFTLDPTKAEFDSLEGIDASTYDVVKGDNGKITITFKNASALKNLDPNSPIFKIVVKLLDESASVTQVFVSAPTYKLTATIPQGGDATVFVVIAAVVAMLGCAAVVVVRKRKIEE